MDGVDPVVRAAQVKGFIYCTALYECGRQSLPMMMLSGSSSSASSVWRGPNRPLMLISGLRSPTNDVWLNQYNATVLHVSGKQYQLVQW